MECLWYVMNNYGYRVGVVKGYYSGAYVSGIKVDSLREAVPIINHGLVKSCLNGSVKCCP